MAGVCGGGLIDARAPKSALGVCDGGRLGAVLGRIEGGIALDEDVEARAERCRVTVVGAGLDIVGFEGLETQVGVG